MIYFNVHTHHGTNESEVVSIQNLDEVSDFDSQRFFSVGIHPWYAGDLFAAERLSLGTDKSVIAIGECGLDKLAATPIELQKCVFERQIQLANELQKPLIIHCVKAHEEVLSCLKKMRNTQAVIFHGFNKNGYWMNRLIDEGYYLSVGKALFNRSFHEVFRAIPTSRLFLETDNSDYAIGELYELATEILNVSKLELMNQLTHNFTQVFHLYKNT